MLQRYAKLLEDGGSSLARPSQRGTARTYGSWITLAPMPRPSTIAATADGAKARLSQTPDLQSCSGDAFVTALRTGAQAG